MVFKTLSKILTPGDDEKKEVAMRALTVNGLDEYIDTAGVIETLKGEMKSAATAFQKRQMEDHIHRHECRLDALRSAAVVLLEKVGNDNSPEFFEKYAITEQDVARAHSGMRGNGTSSPHEVARFLIEEAESDFVSGRA